MGNLPLQCKSSLKYCVLEQAQQAEAVSTDGALPAPPYFMVCGGHAVACFLCVLMLPVGLCHPQHAALSSSYWS